MEVREFSEFNVLQRRLEKAWMIFVAPPQSAKSAQAQRRTPKVPVAAIVTRSNAGLTPQRRCAIAPPLCFAHVIEVLRIFLTGRAGSTDQTKILQRPINFARIAYRTNSAVDETLSFRIADARWVSTVFTLRFRIAPTDLLVCPSAIN